MTRHNKSPTKLSPAQFVLLTKQKHYSSTNATRWFIEQAKSPFPHATDKFNADEFPEKVKDSLKYINDKMAELVTKAEALQDYIKKDLDSILQSTVNFFSKTENINEIKRKVVNELIRPAIECLGKHNYKNFSLTNEYIPESDLTDDKKPFRNDDLERQRELKIRNIRRIGENLRKDINPVFER